MLLNVQHVKKLYQGRGSQTLALRDVEFGVQAGEYVAIMGESGSGKSSLLNIIASFDKPSQGKVYLNDQDITQIKSKDLAQFRREQIGFVFQDFNVLDHLTNKDNILLPMVLMDKSVREMEDRLDDLAPLLGIADLLDKYPYEVSGGQRQRIAIARALVTQPQMILADEPTGALDSKSSAQILGIFKRLNDMGHTILMVTHSSKAASTASRVLFIKDGIIFHELYRGNLSESEFQERIGQSLAVLSK